MTLRLLQITDCHLFADPEQELRGVCTWNRFQVVVEEIKREFADVDRIIMSGDTAHDESEPTCVAVKQALGELAGRMRIVPGNHDNRPALVQTFGIDELCPGRVIFHDQVENWHLIGLDSHIPGEVSGELGEDQLNWLAGELQSCGEDPVLVALHHPPVSIRSRWLDEIGLADSDALMSALGQANVRLVCAGHVHQEHASLRNGISVVTTPAVGPQFQPYSDTLVIDESPPALRVIELEPDGSWFTQVLRISKPA